jgi:hypothetical protein
MRVTFVSDDETQSPLHPTWTEAAIPAVGHILHWRMGGFKPGIYQVESVEWVLDGSISVTVWIRFVKP